MARKQASRDSWSVLLILLVVVLLPTACVLWFMGQAVRNERLAVHQKLKEAYSSLLHTAQGQLETYWNSKVAAIGDIISATSAPQGWWSASRKARTVWVSDTVALLSGNGLPASPRTRRRTRGNRGVA